MVTTSKQQTQPIISYALYNEIPCINDLKFSRCCDNQVARKMFPEEEMVLIQTLDSHTADVTWCDFSGRSTLVSGSFDKLARIWKANKNGLFKETEELPPLTAHRYGINCVRFSPFGTVIASCSIDGSIFLWNSQNGEQVAHLKHPSEAAIRVCAFSPSSAILATGSDDETAILWDLSTRTIIRVLEGHEAMVTSVAFSPDSIYLVTGSTGGDIKLWDARYGHGKCLVTRTEAHDLGVMGCDFSSQFESCAGAINMTTIYLLATCGNDDLVKVWQVRAGMNCTITLLQTLEGHSGNVNCCAFSKCGTVLVSGSGDKTVIIWDPYNGQQLQKLEKHTRYVTCCCFSSDGRLLATGSNDKTILIWSMDGPKNIEENGEEEVEPLIELSTETEVTGPCVGASISAVVKWNKDEVCEWLTKLDLSQYEDIFREHEIDGQELLHLNHETLNNILKIEALGHRNKILRGVQALKNPMWQHNALFDDEGDIPEEFYCPITHEIMRDPVVAADGYTYERGAIMEWLESGKTTSPMTNEGLSHPHIASNRALAALIVKFRV